MHNARKTNSTIFEKSQVLESKNFNRGGVGLSEYYISTNQINERKS